MPPKKGTGCLTKLALLGAVMFAWLYFGSPSFRRGFDSERRALNTATAAASGVPVAAEAPITVRGTSGGESESFALRGGSYRVDHSWSGRGSYFSAALDTPSRIFYARLFSMDAPGEGVAHVHGVRGASYFLRVTCTRCRAWTVTFTPE